MPTCVLGPAREMFTVCPTLELVIYQIITADSSVYMYDEQTQTVRLGVGVGRPRFSPKHSFSPTRQGLVVDWCNQSPKLCGYGTQSRDLTVVNMTFCPVHVKQLQAEGYA